MNKRLCKNKDNLENKNEIFGFPDVYETKCSNKSWYLRVT